MSKKIIKLTEAELTRIIKRVIEEQETPELDEGIFDSILKSFKGAGKTGFESAVAKQMKNVGQKTSKLPLIQQIPNEAKFLIEKLPSKVKVGTKLDDLFKKSMFDIQSLEGSIARLNKEMGGVGGAETYSRMLSDAIKKPKGSIVNLKDMYTNAQFLKKELENIKKTLPKPKQGGILNKNKNFQAEISKYENFLWNDMGKINRFIGNFDEMLKNAKVK